MKRKAVALILGIVLCFSGCAEMFSAYYYSEEPHLHRTTVSGPSYAVEDMDDIHKALCDAIAAFETEMMIIGQGHDIDALEKDLQQVYLHVLEHDPMAAYAVEGMTSRAGQVDGKNVVTVSFEYRYDTKYLRHIRKVETMEDAASQLRAALEGCDGSLVLYVEHYEEQDLIQIAQEYAVRYPDRVVEIPRILTGIYPYTGEARVVDITFSYTMDLASLKQMRTDVARCFNDAVEALPEGASDREVYESLWSFLRDRDTGRYDSSITPAYSLLYHGVGDSKAYATIYAALCERVGMPCQVVRGTRDGQGHCWAVIRTEEGERHLDLLAETFLPRTDAQMEGYVWDPDRVPACPEVIQ